MINTIYQKIEIDKGLEIIQMKKLELRDSLLKQRDIKDKINQIEKKNHPLNNKQENKDNMPEFQHEEIIVILTIKIKR